MTPKSLLRLPDAKSPREDFVSGKFHEILDDNLISEKNKVDRIILTSGKVYYELVKFRKDNSINNSAIIRVEQYYPFKGELLEKIISSYPKVKKIIWVQEEPKNMGAWNFISQRIFEVLSSGKKLYYAGRPESASPAAGSARISAQQQKDLVEQAFNI